MLPWIIAIIVLNDASIVRDTTCNEQKYKKEAAIDLHGDFTRTCLNHHFEHKKYIDGKDCMGGPIYSPVFLIIAECYKYARDYCLEEVGDEKGNPYQDVTMTEMKGVFLKCVETVEKNKEGEKEEEKEKEGEAFDNGVRRVVTSVILPIMSRFLRGLVGDRSQRNDSKFFQVNHTQRSQLTNHLRVLLSDKFDETE